MDPTFPEGKVNEAHSDRSTPVCGSWSPSGKRTPFRPQRMIYTYRKRSQSTFALRRIGRHKPRRAVLRPFFNPIEPRTESQFEPVACLIMESTTITVSLRSGGARVTWHDLRVHI